MSEAVPQFAGLSLTKIGDLGLQLVNVDESPAPKEKEIELAEAKRPPGR
jgi:hypothetical protein